ncbi:MAG: hypothetical protein KatS3mg003_1295 [Candidatus Nitrosocaldaceae archaeon]|nr:MAG: hypothetical protein KatS3mg003_1295 [Candidatus Nitrosocaldaceae archaeon]
MIIALLTLNTVNLQQTTNTAKEHKLPFYCDMI